MPSVQLDACASNPIYLSIGVLLYERGNSVPGKTECVRFQRRTPISLQADQNPDRAVVDCGRHVPMMPILDQDRPDLARPFEVGDNHDDV